MIHNLLPLKINQSNTFSKWGHFNTFYIKALIVSICLHVLGHLTALYFIPGTGLWSRTSSYQVSPVSNIFHFKYKRTNWFVQIRTRMSLLSCSYCKLTSWDRTANLSSKENTKLANSTSSFLLIRSSSSPLTNNKVGEKRIYLDFCIAQEKVIKINLCLCGRVCYKSYLLPLRTILCTRVN